MRLAIFDLDDTLIDGDSASLFCRYLVDRRIAGPELLHQEAELMHAYNHGVMNMADYIALTTAPLRALSAEMLNALAADFVHSRILPLHYPQARRQLQAHRAAGDRCLIISATADFIVRHAAAALGVADALAIDLERDARGCLTGRIEGTPSFREGKVVRLRQWLAQVDQSFSGFSFYSDSSNDLPLLEFVDRPHAVNPDPRLGALARTRNWPVLHWMRATETFKPLDAKTGDHL
jgi:HAD superfamily hydrolase (TIGR01490 family)